MTVTLSIKNVPEELAARLRDRAKRNHRSLQGELLAILEDVGASIDEQGRRMGDLTIDDLIERARRRGYRSPSDSAAIVRADRD
jgi:plasmid stability protein